MNPPLKLIEWIASSLDDLKVFPKRAKEHHEKSYKQRLKENKHEPGK